MVSDQIMLVIVVGGKERYKNVQSKHRICYQINHCVYLYFPFILECDKQRYHYGRDKKTSR